MTSTRVIRSLLDARRCSWHSSLVCKPLLVAGSLTSAWMRSWARLATVSLTPALPKASTISSCPLSLSSLFVLPFSTKACPRAVMGYAIGVRRRRRGARWKSLCEQGGSRCACQLENSATWCHCGSLGMVGERGCRTDCARSLENECQLENRNRVHVYTIYLLFASPKQL